MVDIYVVLGKNTYVDLEVNRSYYCDVQKRNFKYVDKLSGLLFESGDDYKRVGDKVFYQLNLNVKEKRVNYGEDETRKNAIA